MSPSPAGGGSAFPCRDVRPRSGAAGAAAPHRAARQVALPPREPAGSTRPPSAPPTSGRHSRGGEREDKRKRAALRAHLGALAGVGAPPPLLLPPSLARARAPARQRAGSGPAAIVGGRAGRRSGRAAPHRPPLRPLVREAPAPLTQAGLLLFPFPPPPFPPRGPEGSAGPEHGGGAGRSPQSRPCQMAAAAGRGASASKCGLNPLSPAGGSGPCRRLPSAPLGGTCWPPPRPGEWGRAGPRCTRCGDGADLRARQRCRRGLGAGGIVQCP